MCCTIIGLCRFHETVRASHRRLHRRFRSSTLSSNRWCKESHCLREQISVQVRGALSSAQVGIFVWSVCEKFNEYLWGAPKFQVRTDNNPLTYVLTTAKLDATGHRWLAALAAFDFEIEYTPGVSNQDADALSRLPSARIDIASVQAMWTLLHLLQPWPS